MRKTWLFVGIVTISVFLGTCSREESAKQSGPDGRVQGSESADLVEYQEPTRPATKWALLVGINSYRHSSSVSQLAGCVNDVRLMRGLLVGKFDFPQDHILTLTDSQATHAGIVKAFQDHLIAHAERDDIVVFHYSGHGSQMKDVSGDEADQWDETLVPHDSRDPERKVFDISDDDLNDLFQQLSRKTRNITFIFDSCHSGTAIRAAGNVRRAPRDNREPPPVAAPATRGLGDRAAGMRSENLNYTLISGCRSAESSFEHFADGQEGGALTYFLVKELQAANVGATYRDVMDAVAGKVNARYPSQHPQVEGAGAQKVVFGDTQSLAQPYVLCSPDGSGKVKLEAGLVHGVTKGSFYNIHSPGTKQFGPDSRPVARAEITSVGDFMAEGRLVRSAQISNFSRAVEHEHRYPDFHLLVHYEDLSRSPFLRSLQQELGHYRHIETKLQPRDYHLLVRQDKEEIVIEGGDQTEIAPRASVRDPNSRNQVVQRVLHWARWFNVLSIANPAPRLQVRLVVEKVDGGESRGAFERVGSPQLRLTAGDEFQCTVENASGQDLYFTILDLSTDGSVSVIYPPAGAAEVLASGRKWSRRLKSYTPDGWTSVKDVLKVFATTSPIDFRFLEQEATRSGSIPGSREGQQSPLAQLLASAALGATRNVVAPVPLGDWVTAERVVEVVKP